MQYGYVVPGGEDFKAVVALGVGAEAAGATWWMESAWDFNHKKTLGRIRQGPLRIE